MAMIHCRGCGKQIHESAISCPHCGAPQSLPGAALGQGGASEPLPPGVQGWSWGAFFLNWIWAAFNGVWIGLLSLVPFVGVVMMIVLGIKGREWAWRAKKWSSVEEFNRVQRKWSVWAVWLFVVPLLLGIVLSVALPAYSNYKAKAVEREAAAQSAAAEAQSARAEAEAAAQKKAAADRLAAENAAIKENRAAYEAARAAADNSAVSPMPRTETARDPSSSYPADVGSSPQIAAAPQTGDLLAKASQCGAVNACVVVMLEAALPRRADALASAATQISGFAKPQQGDRKTARDLNSKALAFLNAGNNLAAADLLEQAARTDPLDTEIASNLGLALARAGRASEAVTALQSALAIDPRRSSAWAPMAEAFESMGRAEQSHRALMLTYEFSANKQKTIDFYRSRSLDETIKVGHRTMYAKALATIESGY